jgi:uncharacterized protein (DUF1330 family)
MTVYVVAQIRINDRTEYGLYEAGFMPVFEKYQGTMLAVDENPEPFEGQWNATRTVLISFPTIEAAKAWTTSDEYQAIARHRHAASDTDAVFVRGLDELTAP